MSDAAAGGWRRELAQLAAGRGTVAKVAGVRVSLHWTLPPFVAVLVLLWQGRYSTWPWWALGEVAGLYAIVVLPHELGHLAAARSLGWRPREVILWPLGGLALIEPAPATWRARLWFVAAGPLVNVLLVPILFGAWYELGYYRGGDVSALLWTWSWLNVYMLAANVLPIWPLDGGQIVAALSQACLGRTRAAAVVGALGLAGSLALAWAAVRFGDAITGAFAALLAWGNLAWLRSARAMRRYRRRVGLNAAAACPHCGRPALLGPIHLCAACGERGNALLHAGRCWACDAAAGEIACPECGRPSAAGEWLAAT